MHGLGGAAAHLFCAMLPDYGDETGLVSFFEKADVKETAREDEED